MPAQPSEAQVDVKAAFEDKIKKIEENSALKVEVQIPADVSGDDMDRLCKAIRYSKVLVELRVTHVVPRDPNAMKHCKALEEAIAYSQNVNLHRIHLGHHSQSNARLYETYGCHVGRNITEIPSLRKKMPWDVSDLGKLSRKNIEDMIARLPAMVYGQYHLEPDHAARVMDIILRGAERENIKVEIPALIADALHTHYTQAVNNSAVHAVYAAQSLREQLDDAKRAGITVEISPLAEKTLALLPQQTGSFVEKVRTGDVNQTITLPGWAH